MHDTRRTRLVLGVLVAVALALITIDYGGGTADPLTGLRSAGGTLFGSVESAASFITRPFVAIGDGLTGNSGSQVKIAALQQQVLRLRSQLSQAQLSKFDERQLSQLLQLAGRGGYRVVAASVIAAGPAYEDSVTIDAGSKDGIKPDETVLNGEGLVGTVSEVDTDTSTVLLSTDATVTVGVRVAGSGEIGVVSGTGKTLSGTSLLKLQVFDVNAVLKPGEDLVTFGSSGGRPYVAGVPVGVITRAVNSSGTLTKMAMVRPFASDSDLGVVGVVIAPPRTNPRFSVLPTHPATPKPTVTVTVTPTPGGSGGTIPTTGAPTPGLTADTKTSPGAGG